MRYLLRVLFILVYELYWSDKPKCRNVYYTTSCYGCRHFKFCRLFKLLNKALKKDK